MLIELHFFTEYAPSYIEGGGAYLFTKELFVLLAFEVSYGGTQDHFTSAVTALTFPYVKVFNFHIGTFFGNEHGHIPKAGIGAFEIDCGVIAAKYRMVLGVGLFGVIPPCYESIFMSAKWPVGAHVVYTNT